MGEIQRQIGKRAAQNACACKPHPIFGHEDGCRYQGMGPIPGPVDLVPPVGQTTRLSVNGSTSLVVTPPLPCGLAECVAELHITGKYGDTQRVHLSAKQRRELVFALGGTLPLTEPRR